MAFRPQGVSTAPVQLACPAPSPPASRRRALPKTRPAPHQKLTLPTKSDEARIRATLGQVMHEVLAAGEGPQAGVFRAAVPLSFVRGALFGVQERDDSELVRQLLATDDANGVTVGYTGPRLSQQHSRVWQSVVSVAALRSPTASTVLTSAPEILRMMGVKDESTKAKKWLLTKLEDLNRAQVCIKTKRVQYFGNLVSDVAYNNATGRLGISFNPRLADLFKDEIVEGNLARKAAYGRSQLAMWLHDFLASQSNAADKQIPFSVYRMRQLCGSEVEPKEFRRQLKAAAELLRTAGQTPLLQQWSIDEHDVFTYRKVATKVTLLPAGAQARVAAVTRHELAAQAARERRSKVQL